MRLITAPCVGAVVGAVENGVFFALVAVIDHTPGNWPALNEEWIFFVATWGLVIGGVLGGIIGLVVALKDALGRGGLLIGSAIGFACAVFIVSRVGLYEPIDNPWTILALFTIPAAASMGFLSAVATGSNKAPQPKPAAAPPPSYRIFE